MKKKICALVMSTVLCSTAAFAATNVTANLRPDIGVVIDGVSQTFYNVNGQEVHPISYMNTTYLPVRAIGELMGKNVNWDATTSTVSIGGSRVTPNAIGVPDTRTSVQPISLAVHPEYKVVIDGVQRTFYDVSGRVVNPVEYNGSIYLPIRAVSELMGKTVGWNEVTQTVTLTGGNNGSTVTDFDTSNSTNQPVNPVQPPVTQPPVTQPPVTQPPVTQPTQNISVDRAKQIALQHAGVSATSVQFIKAQKDFDDGRWEYEIEFVQQSNGVWKEYDYEIDATTGTILKYDYDVETSYNAGTGGGNSGSSASIDENRAKQIALSRVPGASVSNIYQFKRDFDDGRLEYEGKIVYRGTEYEFTIDAATGRIIDWDVERQDWDD